MNQILELVDSTGRAFVNVALPMLIQSSVLIVALLLADLLLRKRVRAVLRYWLWMLVLVKLMLPPTLWSPIGVGRWFGDDLGPRIAATRPAVKPDLRMMPMPFQMQESAQTGLPGSESAATELPPGGEDLQSRPTARRQPTLLAPHTAASSAATISWQGGLLLLWAAVVSALILLLVQRALFVRGLIAQARPADGSLRRLFEQCCRKMNIKTVPGLRISPNATSPAVCGLLRPVVLIPANLAPSLSREDLQAVLLHELAHIKRGDLWINLVQTVLQIAYFYNPLLWLANAIIRRIREQAVDETVLVALGDNGRDYPDTLVHVAKLALARPALSLRLIGVVESKSALTERIKHMLSRPAPKTAKLGLLGMIILLAVAAIMLPMAKGTSSPTTADSHKQLIVTFAGGVAIELVGVSHYPGDGKQWWRPDGSSVAEPPYTKTDDTFKLQPHSGYTYYQFFLRYRGPEAVAVKWDVPGAAHGSSTNMVLDKAGDRIYNASLRRTSLPADSAAATVRFAVAAGPWETLVKHEPDKKEETYDLPTGSIAFGLPYRRDGGTYLPVVNTVRQTDTRVVAVDLTGKEHLAGSVADRGRTLASRTFIFETPLEQIRQFRFQARPYQWIEFRNVALRRGSDPGFTAVIEPVQQEDAPPTGMIGTWLFDNSSGDDEQMAVFPDGRIVVLYSNGHRDETRYDQEYIEHAEYDNIRVKTVLESDETLLQYHDAGDEILLGKRWRRIAAEPTTEPLRPLSGPNETADTGSDLVKRSLSADNLKSLALATILYQDDNKKPAQDIEKIEPYTRDPDIFQWVRENAVYVGREVSITDGSDRHKRPIAYDKTLLAAGAGTNVVFADGHVEFVSRERLAQFRILAASQAGTRPDSGHGRSVGSVRPNVTSEPRFTVRGTVTDRVMEGVWVNVDCGFDKLRRADRALTDENGRYTLHFKPALYVADADPSGVGIQPAFVSVEKEGFYETSLRHKGNLALAGKPPGPDEQRFVADRAGVALVNEPYELNFVMSPAVRIEGELVDGQGEPLAARMVSLSGDRIYPPRYGFATVRTDKNGRFVVRNVPCTSFRFTCLQPSVARSSDVTFTRAGTCRIRLTCDASRPGTPKLKITVLEQPTSDSRAADMWQDVGTPIPADANDARTLAPGLTLHGIGRDAEERCFVMSLRDPARTEDSQFRFVLTKNDGTVLQPSGYNWLARGGKLWEKFSFDTSYVSRRLEHFHFQSRLLPAGTTTHTPLLPPHEYAQGVDGNAVARTSSSPPGQGALLFDGKDDYLYIPDSHSLHLEVPFTVEVWIKPDQLVFDPNGWNGWGLLAKGCYTGAGKAHPRGFGIHLSRHADRKDLVFVDYSLANDRGIFDYTYGLRPEPDENEGWVHLVHVFDRGPDQYEPAHGHPLVVGKFLIPSEEPIKGQIGEIRIWNKGLTRDQIESYKHAALTGSEPDLVACWTFEQTDGQIAYDITPNRNHARLGRSVRKDNADPQWVELPRKTDPTF